jgi:uncharacterized protein YndB with AHSA1/START domain
MTSPDDALVIVQVFDAPRELVFRNWIESDHVAAWFAPDGFTVTRCEIDARPEGRWRVEYRSDSGVAYVEWGEFQEDIYPERLVFSLMREGGSSRSRTTTSVVVTFADKGAETEVVFRQTGFDSEQDRDNNVEGWQECFRKLTVLLAR